MQLQQCVGGDMARSVGCWVCVWAGLASNLWAVDFSIATFPQLISGGGVSCEIVLTNPGAEPLEGTVYFLDDEGKELQIALEGSTVTSWSFVVSAGGAVRTATDATGDLAVGYAEVKVNRFDSLLAGMLSYRLGEYEVSVPATNLVTEGHVYIERSPDARSGVAITNSSAAPLDLSLIALAASGDQMAVGEIAVPALGKISQFVDEMLDGLPAQFSGSLHLVGDRGFTFVGLRQRSTGSLSILSRSDRAFVGVVPSRFVASTADTLSHVTAEGRVTTALARNFTTFDVVGSLVFRGLGQSIDVYDSAYRSIRRIDPDGDFQFARFKVLPGERVALYGASSDQILIVDFEGQVLATVAPAEGLRAVSSIVLGNDLIISETGSGQLLAVDLRTYESHVFRDFSAVATDDLGPLTYADGVFYLGVGEDEIHRFTETGPLTQIATIPDFNLSGLQVVGDTAYVVVNHAAGKMYAVDLQSGTSQVVVDLANASNLLPAPGTAH